MLTGWTFLSWTISDVFPLVRNQQIVFSSAPEICLNQFLKCPIFELLIEICFWYEQIFGQFGFPWLEQIIVVDYPRSVTTGRWRCNKTYLIFLTSKVFLPTALNVFEATHKSNLIWYTLLSKKFKKRATFNSILCPKYGQISVVLKWRLQLQSVF